MYIHQSLVHYTCSMLHHILRIFWSLHFHKIRLRKLNHKFAHHFQESSFQHMSNILNQVNRYRFRIYYYMVNIFFIFHNNRLGIILYMHFRVSSILNYNYHIDHQMVRDKFRNFLGNYYIFCLIYQHTYHLGKF